MLKHTQPYAFRVSGALFDESVKRLVQFIPFPQHANSSLTPLGQLRWCMIITVNCEFCETLGRRWCLPFFERWLLCVFAGTFSAGWLLSHVRIWTEASHQWLFTHRQGVVESVLHICSHLAPCSDKKQYFTSGRFTCKAPIWKCPYLYVRQYILREARPAIHVDPLGWEQSFWVLHQHFELPYITVWWQHLIFLTCSALED